MAASLSSPVNKSGDTRTFGKMLQKHLDSHREELLFQEEIMKISQDLSGRFGRKHETKTNAAPTKMTDTEPISKGLRYFSVRNRSDGTSFVEEREITLKRSLYDSGRNLDMAKEEDRLKTFARWGHDHIIKKEQLASRGFSYLGDGDRVQCVFCKGILRDWSKGDDALSEHHLHFPTCPFILNLEVGNIPRQATDSTKLIKAEKCSEESSDAKFCVSDVDSFAAHVAYNRRKSQNAIPSAKMRYFNINNRFDVSVKNDGPSYEESDKERLDFMSNYSIFPAALAGFMYNDEIDRSVEVTQLTNEDDNFQKDSDTSLPIVPVQCFACKLTIDANKVTQNTPNTWWKIHAEQRKNCPYVLLNLKRFFSRRKTDVINPDSLRKHRVEPREVRARLDLPIFCKLQSMALDKLQDKKDCRDLLFHVISERLEVHGDDFDTPFDALEKYEVYINDFLSSKAESSDQTVEKYLNAKKEEFERRKEEKRQANRKMQEYIDKLHSEQNEERENLVNMTEEDLTVFHQQLKDNRTCKICMDKTVNTVFLPCGHLVSCHECAPKVKMCPVCRLAISSTVLTTL